MGFTPIQADLRCIFVRFCPNLRLAAGVSLWVLTIGVAHAQDVAKVYFHNGAGILPSPPDRMVRNVAGEPLAGTNYLAQLYVGTLNTPASEFAPISAAPARFRAPTSASIGYWIGGFRTVNGFSVSQTVNLQVRVWDIYAGNTFEEAARNTTGAQYGVSAVFQHYIPSFYECPAISCNYMTGFVGFTLITNPAPPGLTITKNGSSFDVLYEGVHTIEASPDLRQWVPIGNQAGPFHDPESQTLSRRFYRINDNGLYSRNIVGYYRLSLGAGFSLVANQLDTPNNTVASIFDSAPEGAYVYKWDRITGAYTYLAYLDGAWEGDDLSLTLNPGEGAFCYPRQSFTQAFMGDVRLNSSVTIPSGFSIISSPVPIAGPLSLPPPEGLGLSVMEGDMVFQWASDRGGWTYNIFLDGAWEGDGDGVPPFIDVGESFYFYRNGPAGTTWNRALAVGQ
jgi:hypothetical protein